MKTIVEWGHPKHVLNRPCGTSAQSIMPNAKQAAELAASLYFVETGVSPALNLLRPTASEPRKVLWSPSNGFWIAVSLLDGVMRGSYAALADKEAAKRLELADMSTEQQVVAQSVQQTLDAWRGHKSFAWAGECGIFADYAFDKCREKGVEPDVHSFYESLDTESRFTSPPGIPLEMLKEWGVSLNHVWLHLKGRFFDASAPNGVSSLIELPSIQIGIYHSMKEKQPEKLEGLVELFPWWREAARQATEFDKVCSERDAYYEEN